tara:strand:+ start:1371 stop:1670 length:300 start_codon:yes stop_codon:yes gene_type:complete
MGNYDSNNPEHVKKAEAKRQIETDAEVHDLRAIMESQLGRRFMWRLLEQTGLYKTSFTGNSTTFFNEGQRNIGLWLIAQVNENCLDEYTQMVKENREDT